MSTVEVQSLYERIKDRLEVAVDLILKSKSILISMHQRPDGDAIGSAVGLYLALKKLGREVWLFNVDPIPNAYQFLEATSACRHFIDEEEGFDLCCILDCAHPGLLGERFPVRYFQSKVLFIDHHNVPYLSVDCNLHDADASATGEIVFHLIEKLGVGIDSEIANALYTAISTDTGSFRYSCTSSDALRVAASLVERGADVWKVSSNVYEKNAVEKIRLLGKVLGTLRVSACGRLASLNASLEMLKETGCTAAMTDGFINHARSVDGVQVAIFSTQLGVEHYRLSFRSRGALNVSKIAEYFGGGGHNNASACYIQSKSADEIFDRVMEAFEVLYPV